MNRKAAFFILTVIVLFVAGCSQEKLPVAGEGGTPPPFKDRIEKGMANRAAANSKQAGDHPSAAPTPAPEGK